MSIRKFGFELRRIGSVEDLYKDIDLVLQNTSKEVMERETIVHSLQKMLEPSSHFSICTIEACAKICKIIIIQERLDIYHAVHCVSWSQMTEEYRTMLVAIIFDDFREVLA